VTPPTGLLDKGAAAEEWADLRFFRPLGLRLVRWLAPTRVTADQVTLASLVVGLAGGHLFLYRSWWLNGIGLALLIVSDILDSADGQLARLRGTSTRLGVVLDGLSDYARFLNVYVHLGVRIVRAGALPVPGVLGLVILAGLSQSWQASLADFIRRLYLRIGTGAASIELPEELPRIRGLAFLVYRGYLAGLPRWLPRSVAVLRHNPLGLGPRWEKRQAKQVARTAWFGQNIRFLLLAATALPGWPVGFFWLTIGPLNLAAALVLWRHERVAAALGRATRHAPLLRPGRAA
jgi:phosphatidylglycerophosphate synthase